MIERLWTIEPCCYLWGPLGFKYRIYHPTILGDDARQREQWLTDNVSFYTVGLPDWGAWFYLYLPTYTDAFACKMRWAGIPPRWS